MKNVNKNINTGFEFPALSKKAMFSLRVLALLIDQSLLRVDRNPTSSVNSRNYNDLNLKEDFF